MPARDEDVSAGATAAAAAEEKTATQMQAQTADMAAADAAKEDAGEEEETVLLSEVLRHDELMSETANAVLGDCSDTNCSYPMGYMRQVPELCSPSRSPDVSMRQTHADL